MYHFLISLESYVLSGITIAFTGFIYALIVIAARLFYSKTIEADITYGCSSLVSGVQMILLGVLGEYSGETLMNQGEAPLIVKDFIGMEEKKEK